LLFLADYQRWFDCFIASDVEKLCLQKGERIQKPQEADLLLACCDAIIAAQTSVIAAESLGIGSCYIGDIMENYEIHQRLFDLPRYTFPICLLCFGYPKNEDTETERTRRYSRNYIVFENRYQQLSANDFAEMHAPITEESDMQDRGSNFAQRIYTRKFTAEFTKEMRRSAKAILKRWLEQ
jgi:FMN reductase (NADPH)/FMN reductase [NAD(P)H]